MSSKALEAAARALVAELKAHNGLNYGWLLDYDKFGPEPIDVKGKAVWDKLTASVIRAFAQNISEEAAEIIWTARGHKSKQECVCAAIEKDLE